MKTREGTPAHKAPEPKKPYSAPRLVKYGDLRQLTRGGHGRRADAVGRGHAYSHLLDSRGLVWCRRPAHSPLKDVACGRVLQDSSWVDCRCAL